MFDVRDDKGQPVAELALAQAVTGKPPRRVLSKAAKDVAQWRGQSNSYLVGQQIIKELEGLLAADPLHLAPLELQVPGGPRLFWDGRAFGGQRLIKCPDIYKRMKECIESASQSKVCCPR
jgi:hypothetical protein